MKHVDLFCAWPAISREPAGTEPVNPLRGEEQQKAEGHISASHIATASYSSLVPDDDYRPGRGILDDFRPATYKSNVGGSTLNTTGLGVTTNTLGVTNTGLAVSTPGTVGASNTKDFL